jgi:hypothetical protein
VEDSTQVIRPIANLGKGIRTVMMKTKMRMIKKTSNHTRIYKRGVMMMNSMMMRMNSRSHLNTVVVFQGGSLSHNNAYSKMIT